MYDKSTEIEFLKNEVEYKRNDILILVSALRDIYANRGEDEYIAKVVEEAIESISTPA